MNPEDNLFICRKHQLPFFHRGPGCPWCQFMKEVKADLAREYKRGFFDGANAANKERDREEKLKDEQRRNDRAQQVEADRAVPADVPKEQQAGVDPDHRE